MAITDINNIFDAEPKSLAEFLGTNDQGCFIPSYQRAYSWHDTEVDRLFEDTITGLNRLPDAPASLRFLGTIITVTDKSLLGVAEPMDQQLPETVMTLIDGQQRLSTLIIVNILLHDAIRQIRGRLTADELADGFEQVVTDYLYDLVKTFQFTGRPSDTIHQNYPRIIRARVDQWARHQDNARYESPIARLIWAYIEHTAPGQPISPFNYAAPSDAREARGHAALVGVVNHVREALGQVATGSFADRSIIEPHQLVAEQVQQNDFWLAKFPSAVLERFRADTGEAVATLLRLMAFGRYLNTRMAITVVTTAQEDYAFDIFEALNTTGQPLTAFETFRPKVIETEGIANFHYTASAKHLGTIEAFLDRFEKADDRQKATSSILIPFALLDNGGRLEARLAAQRTYLRTTYERLPDLNAKRGFTKALATTSTFLKDGWQAAAGRVANPSPDCKPLHDPEAGFCFEAMRSLRHDITVAPMVRFYAEADGQEGSPSTLAYEGAVKAMTAFSMLWRAAKGGTASIDNRYRTLVSGGTDAPHPLMRRQADGRPSRMPALAELQSSLQAMLRRAKLDMRDAWVTAAAQRAIYSENNLVARFMLLVAMHNSVPDGDTGLVTGDGRGNLNLLTPEEWYSRTTESIEHVAPQSRSASGWPADIYEDSRTVHQLGNLLLLPKLENNEAANHSWRRKRMLLGIFAAEGRTQARERLDAAQAEGITLGKRAEAIALENHVLPLCRAAATYSGEWDADFISRRSRRLAELAWDRMSGWLGRGAGVASAPDASAPTEPDGA